MMYDSKAHSSPIGRSWLDIMVMVRSLACSYDRESIHQFALTRAGWRPITHHLSTSFKKTRRNLEGTGNLEMSDVRLS
jgi:hypothetical protein